jgi:RNA polymerase sigma-70 factor, ECF subfamily
MNGLTRIDTTRMPDIQNTDPHSWVELYGDYLFNFAVGQIRNVTEAEDLVQETFLAALKAQNRFIGQSSVRTWLIGILRHKICDHLRAKRRTPTVLAPDAEENDIDESFAWLHETAEECIGPDRRMDLQDFRAALEDALGTLPTRVAQAFKMYEIDDCSSREICETLDISEGNLWVMLHRARTQLRTQLAPVWRT